MNTKYMYTIFITTNRSKLEIYMFLELISFAIIILLIQIITILRVYLH